MGHAVFDMNQIDLWPNNIGQRDGGSHVLMGRKMLRVLSDPFLSESKSALHVVQKRIFPAIVQAKQPMPCVQEMMNNTLNRESAGLIPSRIATDTISDKKQLDLRPLVR